jgi:putative chitinase
MEIPFAQSPVLEESVGKIMTKVPKGANQLEGLREALTEFEINTPLRQAAFLAIVAFESDELQMTREFANSAQAERLYGPATGIGKGLGNTLPGDGERFKGRGYIQIVGRNNYSNAGNSLGLDLLSKPELLEEPRNAWRAAGWYWRKTNINAAADRRDFRSVVNLINPGMLGYQLRLKYYRRALAVLSVNPGEVESLIYDGVDTGPKPR